MSDSSKWKCVFGELEDVCHRIAITRQRESCLLVGVERVLTEITGCNVFETCVVAVDRVEPCTGAGEGEAAQ